MSCRDLSSRIVVLAALAALLPAAMPAQEHRIESILAEPVATSATMLRAERDSLLRLDFAEVKNWARVKSGATLDGRLTLPLYDGEQIAAPAGSEVKVTIRSVEKVREPSSFWRKTGKAIVRAFNPFTPSRPAQYRVQLSGAELVLPGDSTVPLNAQVLRANSALLVEPRVRTGSPDVAAVPRKGKATGMLLFSLAEPVALAVPVAHGAAAEARAGEVPSARAFLLTSLRSSTNHRGDTFRAQLAEPVRLAGRLFPAGTIVEGSVLRSVAPRMLSRAGSLSLRINRVLSTDGPALNVGGTLGAAEADSRMQFALDEEGALRGRKPGLAAGLADVGYAYVLGKLSDDMAETPIRALGATMSDTAVANAARYVGLGTSAIFLITRHGRDVYLPQYALIQIDFGRAAAAPISR